MTAASLRKSRGHARASHWDKWARDFDDHVCDIASTDPRRVIPSAVRSLRLPARSPRLIDLGCGRGTFLRRFGRGFESCVGVDFSSVMLRLAAAACRRLQDVAFIRSDARQFRLPSPPRATLIACFNVATSPSASDRRRIWNVLSDSTEDGGHALVVVPSLESARAVDHAARERRIRTVRRLLPGGIAAVDGVRQRFFTREELAGELTGHAFNVKSVRKVWYPWREEGLDGRSFPRMEMPWDWLAVATREPRRRNRTRR
jgi:SAM-dependent methyltransferase